MVVRHLSSANVAARCWLCSSFFWGKHAMFKRLALIWVALRSDLRLLWLALRHPQSPGWLKLGVAALGLYLLLPIDFIPDFIPGLGVVDDVLVVTFGVRALLKRLPAGMKAQLGIV
jgi:uncharacterized membrane protein YkvA (DUF1232 family)